MGKREKIKSHCRYSACNPTKRRQFTTSRIWNTASDHTATTYSFRRVTFWFGQGQCSQWYDLNNPRIPSGSEPPFLDLFMVEVREQHDSEHDAEYSENGDFPTGNVVAFHNKFQTRLLLLILCRGIRAQDDTHDCKRENVHLFTENKRM